MSLSCHPPSTRPSLETEPPVGPVGLDKLLLKYQQAPLPFSRMHIKLRSLLIYCTVPPKGNRVVPPLSVPNLLGQSRVSPPIAP
jgi:hypothetical protein